VTQIENDKQTMLYLLGRNFQLYLSIRAVVDRAEGSRSGCVRSAEAASARATGRKRFTW
jgi:hypothetical protein